MQANMLDWESVLSSQAMGRAVWALAALLLAHRILAWALCMARQFCMLRNVPSPSAPSLLTGKPIS